MVATISDVMRTLFGKGRRQGNEIDMQPNLQSVPTFMKERDYMIAGGDHYVPLDLLP